jgi:ribose transport system permease protein
MEPTHMSDTQQVQPGAGLLGLIKGRMADGRRISRRDVARVLVSNVLLLAVIALVVVFASAADNFLTVGNIRDILRQSSATMVVAVPTALLLISGKVDLSIGSTLALGAVTTGLLITEQGASPLVASLGGVAAGTFVGLVNGILSSTWRWSPIIVTLGTLTAVRGLTLTLAPDPVFGFGSGFTEFGNGDVLGIPYLVLVAAVVVAAGAATLAIMPVGRHLFAIGVNEEAAFLSGIRVRRTTLALFVLSGAAAGLAGVMFAARLSSAPSATLGVGFELDVLTAVLLGGVAFDGGRGSIRGVVLGVLFLAILQNGLTILNAPTSVALLVKGLALVFAAGLDRASARVSDTRKTV